MAHELDGNWLDARLDEIGSNRAGLARALAKDRATVTKIVQGKRALKLREVDIIATHLRCSREAVLHWAGLSSTGEPTGFDEMKQSEFKMQATPLSPAAKSKAVGDKARHPLFGIWKGKVTLDPNYDYTQPADPDWGKVYDD